MDQDQALTMQEQVRMIGELVKTIISTVTVGVLLLIGRALLALLSVIPGRRR
jgi:hypothetical protein